MKILSRILSTILFVIFFVFALKNTQEAALQFFLGHELRGPLILLLLIFLAAGAVIGVLAMMPTVFRYRRELHKHKKAMIELQKENETQQLARTQPPQPDSIADSSANC